jgi:hypothetical protein
MIQRIALMAGFNYGDCIVDMETRGSAAVSSLRYISVIEIWLWSHEGVKYHEYPKI